MASTATPPAATQPGGYHFGDVTKAVIRTVIGKEQYQFGDITRAIDRKLKESGKHHSKSAEDPYEFGDVTRELMSRLEDHRNGDKTVARDAYSAMRNTLSAGINVSSVADSLPGKLLVDMLSVGLDEEEEEVDSNGKRSASTKKKNSPLNTILAHTLDKKLGKGMKEDKSHPMDAKRSNSQKNLVAALLSVTGEKGLSVGSVARAVASFEKKRTTSTARGASSSNDKSKAQKSKVLIALAEAVADWDDNNTKNRTSGKSKVDPTKK